MDTEPVCRPRSKRVQHQRLPLRPNPAVVASCAVQAEPISRGRAPAQMPPGIVASNSKWVSSTGVAGQCVSLPDRVSQAATLRLRNMTGGDLLPSIVTLVTRVAFVYFLVDIDAGPRSVHERTATAAAFFATGPVEADVAGA